MDQMEGTGDLSMWEIRSLRFQLSMLVRETW